MKKYILLFAFGVVFSSFESVGQVYEKVYELSGAEVQNKMNQNKIDGIDILSTIHASKIVGIAGLNASSVSNLQQALTSNPKIESFNLSEDLTSIGIEAKASFTKDELAQLLSTFSVIITGYSVVYSIKED
ncbi:hypothetical protein [Fluviicola sp.]|jgi:ABC-type uncharacterized transport system ATPase subunit|uniref:hypothetical protein n=1 Tax=Fluviicola sp. TaxID=1917219 RepID=UPI002827EF3A|nr:hypothetical protein [Fluviicola sp.]MDR0803320.1 hypothetical protein [Fluviicola sp.]